MADLSDNDIFDSITTGGAAAEPSDKQEPVITQPQPQARDDSGRFAPVETPVAQPTPELHAEPAPTNGGNVPVGAVQAEREKRKEAQLEAETLRREIAELRGMVQARQPAPQPQQEKPAATLWDDPDAFLASQLTPIQQQMFDQKAGFSKMLASDKHGADVVEAALQAALAAKDTPEGRILDEKLAKSVHPFDEMVQWHKQQASLARVGNDPDAWLNAEIEKRLADPAFLAQAVERARAGVAAPQNGRPQPVTSIPPSLSRLPSGGNTAPPGGDAVNDAGLFASTTSGRRGNR